MKSHREPFVLRAALALLTAAALPACGGGARPAASAGAAKGSDEATRATALVPVLDDAARALCLLGGGAGDDPLDADCEGLDAAERFAGEPVAPRLVARRLDPLATELRARTLEGLRKELREAAAAPFADAAAGHRGLHADLAVSLARATSLGAAPGFGVGAPHWVRLATDLPPTDADDARALDGWRERVLAKIAGAFAAGESDRATAEAADDALDALERGAEARSRTMQAVARLRGVLARVDKAPAAVDAAALGRAVSERTGDARPLAQLAAELDVTRRAVGPALGAALEARPRDERSAILEEAAALVLGRSPCRFADAPSRVRGLVVPDERRAPCVLAPRLGEGGRGHASLAAAVAAHDDVVLALRVLAAAKVEGAAHEPSLALLGPTHGSRADHGVRAEPVALLASGLGAARLLAGGLDDAPRRAAAWARSGDTLYPDAPR